ncbi:MAG: prepilin-type N-terminal cleavage/methylation domain-containing protein [Pseudomonadota bacterium]
MSEVRAGSAHGFTLVETIISMVVISIAVLGITSTLAFSLKRQSDGLWQSKAAALGTTFMEEILARRFDEQTPVGGEPPCAPTTTPCSPPAGFADGEARSAFDDVDDYDGLDEQPPRDESGVPMAEFSGYRVQISVRYPSAAQQAALGVTGTDIKVVDLRVTPPGQSPLLFSFVRANW